MNGRKAIALLGFLIGAGALILQLSLTVPAAMQVSEFAPEGRTMMRALNYYFSFFTILSNLALVLVYLADLTPPRQFGKLRSPVVRTAMAAMMALVTIFYHLLVANSWAPEGLFKLADVTLHYVTPLLYLFWWFRFLPHGGVDWRNLPGMLAPVVIYFAYIMLRGFSLAEYPYAIFDAGKLGYSQVAINALFVAIGFAALCALFIALDKTLARRQVPASG